MSGKVKMRCARCGKTFRSAGAKQTLCPQCEAKARVERAASKSSNARPMTTPAPAPPPRIVGPGASILVPGLAAAPVAGERHTASGAHAGRETGGADHDGPAHKPPQPAVSKSGAHPGPGKGAPATREPRKAAAPARRERAPVRAPELTDELRARIEARYLELSQPVEFDGIRTQIATELGVPRTLVKKAVLELRQRLQLPSWWELKAYTGGDNMLDRIRQAYVPHLPVPPIGVHQVIAEQLGLEPAQVYQGIRRIRAEMHLPRYNPPAAHTGEQGSEAVLEASTPTDSAASSATGA
jgi:DNA-directed RNA polymerase subunit RPC12/RpoP